MVLALIIKNKYNYKNVSYILPCMDIENIIIFDCNFDLNNLYIII